MPLRPLEGALCESGLGVLVWEGLVPRRGLGKLGGQVSLRET